MASQFVSIAAQHSVFRSARSPALIVFDEDVCTMICCSNSSHKFSGCFSHNIFDNLVTHLGFLYSGFLQHEPINIYFYFTCPHPTFDKTQWHSSLLPVTHLLHSTTTIHWLLAAALHEAFFFFNRKELEQVVSVLHQSQSRQKLCSYRPKFQQHYIWHNQALQTR